jgi:hypothetical protein
VGCCPPVPPIFKEERLTRRETDKKRDNHRRETDKERETIIEVRPTEKRERIQIQIRIAREASDLPEKRERE